MCIFEKKDTFVANKTYFYIDIAQNSFEWCVSGFRIVQKRGRQTACILCFQFPWSLTICQGKIAAYSWPFNPDRLERCYCCQHPFLLLRMAFILLSALVVCLLSCYETQVQYEIHIVIIWLCVLFCFFRHCSWHETVASWCKMVLCISTKWKLPQSKMYTSIPTQLVIV